MKRKMDVLQNISNHYLPECAENEEEDDEDDIVITERVSPKKRLFGLENALSSVDRMMKSSRDY